MSTDKLQKKIGVGFWRHTVHGELRGLISAKRLCNHASAGPMWPTQPQDVLRYSVGLVTVISLWEACGVTNAMVMAGGVQYVSKALARGSRISCCRRSILVPLTNDSWCMQGFVAHIEIA